LERVRDYIDSNYKIAENHVNSVELVFVVAGSRTQVVRITNMDDSGWVEISTAICREDEKRHVIPSCATGTSSWGASRCTAPGS